MAIEEEVAVFIAERRRRRRLISLIWQGVEAALVADRRMEVKDLVAFLWDTYYLAMEKITKSSRNTFIRTSLKEGNPSFKALQRMIPWVEEARINPFSFFVWAIEQRRLKQIPPTVINICSQNTFEHFVNYLARNTYRVQSCAKFISHEKQLINQLDIDLTTFTTFQLRKQTASLGQADANFFSPPTRALLSLRGVSIELVEEDLLFQEDLEFDPEFKERMQTALTELLRKQIGKVRCMVHTNLQENYVLKIDGIVSLLEVLMRSNQ